jgi:hypothetical protein
MLLGRDAYNNPNLLEFNGQKSVLNLIQTQAWTYSTGASLSSPCCAVITTNKVQNTFEAVPIYTTTGGDIEALNSHVLENPELSFHYASYRQYANTAPSVHIGALFKDAVGCAETSLDDSSEVKVSVVLPVYNGEKFIEACVESVLAQTGVVFELIIVDDGSSDGTVRLILDLCSRVGVDVLLGERNEVSQGIAWRMESRGNGLKSNCKYVNIAKMEHVGLIAALDIGISIAKTNFIMRMDADDICMPHRMREQYDYMYHNPNILVLGGQALLINEVWGSDRLDALPAAYELATGIPCHPVSVHLEMFHRCCVIHPAAMMRREAVLSVGGYTGASDSYSDRSATSVEDYALWMRLLSKYVLYWC